MNLFETEEFFKNMYPGKKITMEFDDKCHREINFIFTDGAAHGVNHIAFNKVKVTVEGMPSQYVPIQNHRACTSWNELKRYITSRADFHVTDQDLDVITNLQDLPEGHSDKQHLETKISEVLSLSELTKPKLLEKVQDYRVNRKNKS